MLHGFFFPLAGVVILGVALCLSPFVTCAISRRSLQLACVSQCGDHSFDPVGLPTFPIVFFAFCVAHGVSHWCLARCLVHKRVGSGSGAALYQWTCAYFVAASVINGASTSSYAAQHCMPMSLWLSVFHAVIHLCGSTLKNLVMHRVLIEKILTLENSCLVVGTAAFCCCSLSSSMLSRLLKAEVFILVISVAVFTCLSFFGAPRRAIGYFPLAFVVGYLVANLVFGLSSYRVLRTKVRQAKVDLKDNAALGQAIVTATRNYWATMIALLTTTAWQACVGVVLVHGLFKDGYYQFWPFLRGFGFLDSVANDLCLAVLLGTAAQAERASSHLREVSLHVDMAASLELGACTLLAARVSGTLQVCFSEATGAGHHVIFADAGAKVIFGASVVGTSFELFASPEEARRVEAFLASIPVDMVPAMMLPATLMGIEMHIYGTVIAERPDRTLKLWIVLPSLDFDAYGPTDSAISQEPGHTSLLCVSAVAPSVHGSVPWPLLCACVDGFLRVVFEDGRGHRITSVDSSAARFLGMSDSSELSGTCLEDLVPADEREELKVFLASPHVRHAFASSLCGRRVQLFASVLAKKPQVVLAVWLADSPEAHSQPPVFEGCEATKVDLAKPIDSTNLADPLCARSFTCTLTVPVLRFFSSSGAEGGLVMDQPRPIIVECGRRMFRLGFRAGDEITFVNQQPVTSSADFRDIVCGIFDELQASSSSSQVLSRDDGTVILTLRRARVSGDVSPMRDASSASGSVSSASVPVNLTQASEHGSVCSSARCSWQSMGGTATTGQPNAMGLPGIALHQRKREEFDLGLTALREEFELNCEDSAVRSPLDKKTGAEPKVVGRRQMPL